MRGAEALLRTLVAGGVDVCFTNPGTSEMQFVAALDRVPQMRAILTLFEGVATGAADGYARMTGRPASTLLHLGPGLTNGLANLHNAQRARIPMVNVVGEHATFHRQYEAPLTTDIASYANQVSGWTRTVAHPSLMGADTAAAIAAARQAPGQIATLITPADCTWTEGALPGIISAPPTPPRVDQSAIDAAAMALRSGEPAMLLLSGDAVHEQGLRLAARIATATGARASAATFFARMARGAGRALVERVPYALEAARQFLAGVRHLILVGAAAPVSFFAYPNRDGWLTPADAQIHTLARPEHDLLDALERLADAVSARADAPVQQRSRVELPSGTLSAEHIGRTVAALMPEQTIVVEEAISSMGPVWTQTTGAAPHDWLVLTGGAIGIGMPLAVGAAVACPGRRVLNLQADGSAAYTLQALWTQAREHLDVTTIIYANRIYRILEIEFRQTGAGDQPGERSQRVMSLDAPTLDWIAIARGMGVPARRVETAEQLAAALRESFGSAGPLLIEAII